MILLPSLASFGPLACDLRVSCSLLRFGRRTRPVLGLTLLLLCFSACSSGPAEPGRANDLQLTLGPTLKVRLPDARRRPVLFAGTDSLSLALFGPGTVTIIRSPDEGRSWLPMLSGPRPADLCEYDPRFDDFHALRKGDQGIDHEVLLPSGASVVTRVADVSIPHMGHFALRCFPDGQLGVVWTDSSSGWPQIMFSASSDHGKRWSLPVAVGSPSRPAEVFAPYLDRQAGTWYITWPENQGRSTLFDIYTARSGDGRTWLRGPRVNDDEGKVWNWLPVSCGDRDNLFVAFSDYRERDRWGEPDENVYFARLAAPNLTAAANRRLNDSVAGTQSYPRLSVDPQSGRLLSVWLDARDRLTMDVYASFSDNSGETWSVNQRVSENQGREMVSRPELAQMTGGDFFMGWSQIWRGTAEFHLRRVLGVEAKREPTPRPVAPEVRRPVATISDSEYSREMLGAAGFRSDFTRQWTPVAGNWLINGPAVVGFGKSPPYLNWKGGELDDFIAEGRFRLNRLRHYDASLIFRSTTGPDGRAIRGFMLRNHFRQGVWLVASDSGFANWEVNAGVLAETAFPFRSDNWYRFRLVVLGNRLDYYIDGRLMLSSADIGAWRSGGFSLTTIGPPAEFADLRFYRLTAAR